MATEAKMGMCIIVILVGAFGFLVYHKFDLRQRQLLAAQVKPSGGPSTQDEDAAAQQAAEAKSASFAEFAGGGSQEATSVRADSGRQDFDVLLQEPELPFEPAPFQPDEFVAASQSDVDRASEPAFADFSEEVTPANESQQVAASFDQPPFAELAVESQTPFEPTETDTPFNQTGPAAEEPTIPSFSDVRFQEALAANESSTNPEFVDQFEPAPEFPPEPSPSGQESILFDPAIDERASQTELVAMADPDANNPFATPIEENPLPPDSPVDFMANVQPEPLAPVEPTTDPFVNAAQTNIAAPEQSDPNDELMPLVPLAPANTDIGRLDPDTAIAMLEPTVDVNLFEDTPDRRGPPVSDPEPEFPAAAEPEAPDFPGFDEAPRTFEATPETETFPPSDLPAETITAPKTNLFEDANEEPFVPSRVEPDLTDQVPLPEPPVARDQPREFGATTEPAPRRAYDPPPGFTDDEPFDVNAPGVGVAHIVPGARKIQLTAATEDCAICEVQAKDNYWTISRRAYGTARYFSSLAEYNRHRISDPRKLKPGMKVLVPDPKILEARYPEFFEDQRRLEKRQLPTGFFLQKDGSPAYRVGARETLGEISQKHLGRASRWIQIFRMNRQILQDPNKLKQGIVLTLPDDATNVQSRP